MFKQSPKDSCFVVDEVNMKLAPTTVGKGWYLIRKGRAKLVNSSPMVIQLVRIVENPICDTVLAVCEETKSVGIAIIQECPTKNKVAFKAVIQQRMDVKKRMTERRNCRRIRRSNKRYRKPRFNNRSASTRKGRIAPSILQKRQSVIRLLNKLSKWINISKIVLADVKIDIRALSDGYKPYKWQYQKSNRLDENLRKATILRDTCCVLCGVYCCSLKSVQT